MKTLFTRCTLLVLCLGLVSGLTAQTVYWGDQPGEGDFDGSLDGWTSEVVSGPDSSWVWVPNGLVTGGFLSDQDSTINSPTASNGAAVFNMDAYTNGPNGPVPPRPFPEYVVDLISETIDLSDVPAETALSIEFHQLYKWFEVAENNLYFSSYAISTDDGVTWTAPIDANPGVPGNFGGSGIPPVIGMQRVRIPFGLNAAGSNTVKIKFTVAGNFYYWAIDDVKIIERPTKNDLTVSPIWYAVAPYAKIPLSQVEPISFMTDVENVGANTAENVVLSIDVEDGSGGSVYNQTEAYGTLGTDSLDQNRIFGSFTPTEVNEYLATYSVSSDSTDEDISNSELDFSWEVTETTFAKENGPNRSIQAGNTNWSDGVNRSWAYGNHYYIVNGSEQNLYANTASFVIDNADVAEGLSVNVKLWKWNADVDLWMTNPDALGSGIYQCPPDDREEVGFANYTIEGSEDSDEFITVYLIDQLSLSPGVPLVANTHYILMLEMIGTAEDDSNVIVLGANDEIDWTATGYLTTQQGHPRFGAMIGLNSNGLLQDATYNNLGFGRDIVPCVRMDVDARIDSATDILKDVNINIYPSPADEFVTVDIDLSRTFDDVSVRVVNSVGTLITKKAIGDMQRGSVNLNTEDWINGSYFLQIITDEGIKTERFLIQR
ncbi:MAG: T9SS type A sorting domain-containing protein [Saprospiraceae bacterium]